MMRRDKNSTNAVPRTKPRSRPGKPPRKGRASIGLPGGAAFLLFVAAVYAVLIAGQRPLGVKLGEGAPRTFTARARFTRVDLEFTRAARERAKLATPPVFRMAQDHWEAGVQNLLRGLRGGEKSMLWQSFPEGFDRRAFARLVPALQPGLPGIEEALASLGQRYLVDRADLAQPLVQGKETRQAVLRGPAGEEQALSISELIGLDGEAGPFREAFSKPLEALEPPEAALARQGFAYVLRPNVMLDLERSTENAGLAAAMEPEVTESVEKGRVILAKGSEVRRQHVEDLLGEREQYWAGSDGRIARIQRLGGLAVLLLLIMAGAAIHVQRHRPGLLRRGPQLLAFMVLTVALVGMARLCIVWGVTPLWVPVPLVVMIMCLVFDQRFGLGAALFYALLVRLGCPGADSQFFVLLVGGVMAALLSGEVRTRTTLIKAGLLTGAVQFCWVWGLGLMVALDGSLVPLRFWQSALLLESVAAVLNGVLSGFIVSGILPAIERLFGVTTDIRLLEWSDPNRPLLQRMLLDAPGTYHHSMVVGSLAADAAEAVGANPLLARVSAYFHDVGKLKKP
ncbi:MAG: HDIG domain-containing protein, partial [Candidatus Brocadiae bacterium]|nr:HDIG domain-containing protein [Candidatus Brocadiia bacterium]